MICDLHLIIAPHSLFTFIIWVVVHMRAYVTCVTFYFTLRGLPNALCYVQVATSNRWRLFLSHDYDYKSIKRLHSVPSDN